MSAPRARREIGRDASRPFGLEASGAPPRKGPLAVEASLPCGPCRDDAHDPRGDSTLPMPRPWRLIATFLRTGSVGNSSTISTCSAPIFTEAVHNRRRAGIARLRSCGWRLPPFPRREPVLSRDRPLRPIFPLKVWMAVRMPRTLTATFNRAIPEGSRRGSILSYVRGKRQKKIRSIRTFFATFSKLPLCCV